MSHKRAAPVGPSRIERSESRPVFTRRYLNRSRVRDLVGRRLDSGGIVSAVIRNQSRSLVGSSSAPNLSVPLGSGAACAPSVLE